MFAGTLMSCSRKAIKTTVADERGEASDKPLGF